MRVVCTNCDEEVSSCFTSERTSQGKSKPFNVNDTVVTAALMTGLGPQATSKLCQHLNVPALYPSTFLKKVKIVYKKAEKKVVELVKKAHCASDNPPVNGFTDTLVSFDSS